MTGTSIPHLASIPKLTSLNFGSRSVDDARVQPLAQSKSISQLRPRTTITYRFSLSSSGRLWPLLNSESQIPRLRSGQAPNSYASGFAQSITTKSNLNLSG